MGDQTRVHPIRVTPAIAAAMAGVPCLLAARHLPASLEAGAALLLGLPACGFAAAAFALAGGGAGRRLLLAAAAGCMLAGGAELGERIAAAGAGAGLPLDRVDELHGVLLDDASLRDAGVRYRIAVHQVSSRRLDARASARFVALVTLPAETAARAHRGRRVTAAGVVLFGAEAGRQPVHGRAREALLGGYAAHPAAVRAAARIRLERLILDLRGPSAALLAAVLLGDRHHLAAEQVAAFRRAGALHLLALSGLHVGLVYLVAASAGRGLALAGMAVAPRWQRGWVAAAGVLGVAAVFVYVELAGARPSLARATTMLALARLAAAAGRRPGSVNVLALSALMIVATDPRSVHELSFQLSYAALLGILLAGPPVARALPALLPPGARAAAGMAVGAQLATLPLVLATFGRAHPIGVVSGLVLVPCTALFLWVGIGALVVSALSGGSLDAAARVPLHLLYIALTMLNSLFGNAPGVRW